MAVLEGVPGQQGRFGWWLVLQVVLLSDTSSRVKPLQQSAATSDPQAALEALLGPETLAKVAALADLSPAEVAAAGDQRIQAPGLDKEQRRQLHALVRQQFPTLRSCAAHEVRVFESSSAPDPGAAPSVASDPSLAPDPSTAPDQGQPATAASAPPQPTNPEEAGAAATVTLVHAASPLGKAVPVRSAGNSAPFLHFTLYKRNKDTMTALSALAQAMRGRERDFGCVKLLLRSVVVHCVASDRPTETIPPRPGCSSGPLCPLLDWPW